MDKTPETLTPTERLQFANQFAILEKLDQNNAEYYAKGRKILESGYTLLYGEIFQTVSDELPVHDCNFVYDVLETHRDLIQSYAALTDKAGITPDDVRFRGFDGNNESEFYGFVQFLQEHGLWKETLTGGLNSHAPTIDRYREMVAKRKKIRDQYEVGATWHDLTAEEIKEVVYWKFQAVGAA
jgi:uncharacterized protein YfbU (UPF0304 family)